jgi:hypothetical protein
MALLCGKAAASLHAGRDDTIKTAFDALQVMNLVFMLYIAGNPMLVIVQQAIPPSGATLATYMQLTYCEPGVSPAL